MAVIRDSLITYQCASRFFIGKSLAFSKKRSIVHMPLLLLGMNLSDISWDTVRMVSIDQCTLRITTDIAVHTYSFNTADELSQALLILSLNGTRKVEDMDDLRFNPARFLPGYNRKKLKTGGRSESEKSGEESDFLTDGSTRLGN